MADPRYRNELSAMRLLIVNPNSTSEMTDRIGAEARNHLPDGVALTLRTNDSGPAAIQGAVDGKAAIPGALALLKDTPCDVAVIGCFDDIGLSDVPADGPAAVIGLGEAAIRTADRSGRRFAVLTTSDLSVPVLEANLRAYGAEANCVCVQASMIGVLDFERNRVAASQRLIAAARRLLDAHPDIETIVLGCAGMGGLASDMAGALHIPVIDPIEAAIGMALQRHAQNTAK